MSKISFKIKLSENNATDKIESALIKLPKSESIKLPSRGTSMVEGTINGSNFQVALEPDGQGSHWFVLDKTMCNSIGVDIGDTVNIEVDPMKIWPEPEVPKDLEDALGLDSKAHDLWLDITPMARWDWIHWFESVKLAETRRERPAKLCSMLKSGKRRPCCFNRTILTHPKSAKLY